MRLLLAAVAAGSVAHAASATTMSLEMALADGEPMDMADCEGCGSGDDRGDGGPGCEMTCLAPMVAYLSEESTLAAMRRASPTDSSLYDFVGRTGPPEPYPPRTLI
jgi:hypothetical protein